MKKKSLLIVAILTFVLSFAFAACGETTPDPEPTPTPAPHTHEYVTYTWVEGSVPSETADGKATAKCTGCDETTTVDVAKLTDDSVWTMTATAATCTEDGKKVYTSKYGTVEVAIPAEHTFGDLVAATDSTCLKKGNVAYYHCTVCEKNFAEDKTTELESVEKALADHVYGTLIEATTSTCVEHGTVEHYHCSVCGKDFDADKNVLDTIEVPLAAHTFGDLVAAVASTCQTHGNVAYYHCSVCEKNFAEDKTTVLETVEAPLGAHNYGEWQKGDENGHFRACQTAGCTETKVEPHDYTGQSCYRISDDEHRVECKVCGYEHHERHEFGDWTKKDETNHAQKCAKCTMTVTEAHTGGTATCKAQAVCTVCHEGYGNLADHVLGADGKCTVCGKTPNAVFGKTYSAFTVNASGTVDTSVNALLTFDANGKAEGVTGSVSIIKKNGHDEEIDPNGYYYDDTIGVIYSESAVYIRYVDKEKGTIQFVSSYKKATETYAGSGKYGTPKLTEKTYDGYITATNGFIFIPQGYGSSIVLVPTDTAVTTADVIASAFNTRGKMNGKIFFKYTGTEAHSVYYDASKSPVVVAIDATITDFDDNTVEVASIKTAKAMVVKDKDGNVLAKYGYDDTQVVELDDWAGKYEGTAGTVTVWGTGKITTPYGEGDYVEVADKDYNIEVTYVNEDGDVIHYIEVKANKENKTYESSEPSIDVTYDLGDYGTTYTNTQGKKVTFTLPAAPTPTNEAYMFSGWSIGGDVYKQPGDKVAFEANTTVTAIWQMKVKITVVDEKNAANSKYFYAGADENLLEVIAKNTTTVLDGEEFKYWTIEVDGEPTEVGPDWTVGEHALTVTAVWKVKYTLTLVYGNGLANATETYFEGYATNPEKPTFTNGQVFDGWFTDAECTVAYTPAALTGDLTIYAKWITAAVPFVGTSYALSVNGLKDTTYNDITLYGDSRYYVTVDANGFVTDSDSSTFKNQSILFDSATNTFTINGYTGKYFPEQQAFAIYKYTSGVRKSLSVYFLDATAVPLVEPIKYSGSTNAYQYNNAKYLFLKASVTRNGETTPFTMFVDEDNFYFDIVVEKGTKSGDTYNYTELTSFSSMSIPDQVKVYNADKSTLIATLDKPTKKYTLYKALGTAGEYTATVDGVVSEDKVVLDDYGISMTFGSLTGTYALNAEKTAYDVYLNSNKVYYSMTIDFEAKTATLVKEMVTISFDLNTVSGVDMGTFASVSVNKNVELETSAYVPTKEGYKFKYWYKTYTDGTLSDRANYLTPTENITLYAEWVAAYTVTFETEHGNTPESLAVEDGDSVVKADFPTLTDEAGNYTFKGWYVKGDAEKTIVSGSSYTVNANVTFVAKWIENVSITLVSGIEGLNNKVVKVCPGDTFDLSAIGFGYYKTDAMEKGKIVSGYYTDAACTDGNEFTATSVTEATIVYAKWVESEPYAIVMAYYSEAGKGKGKTSKTDSTQWYAFEYDITNGCWKSTNQAQKSTMSSMKIVAYGTLTITFQYSCGGETNYDMLYIGVTKNGAEINNIANESNSSAAPTKKDGGTITLNPGECLEFVYSKDNSGDKGDDTGKIYGLTINGQEITKLA